MSGTTLSIEFLVAAYSAGFFPMAEHRYGPLRWYSPDPRCIIPLEAFRVSRSLRRVIRQDVFSITVDEAFCDVIAGCANRDETWISEEIVRAYTALHRHGLAHSVEAWCDGRLAGGLYGVSLGTAFFGESMFSLVSNASSVCLVYLVDILREHHFDLLDSQIMNDHVRQFGAIEISIEEYLRRLAEAITKEPGFPVEAPRGTIKAPGSGVSNHGGVHHASCTQRVKG